MNAWELIDGDNTLLTHFDLNEESIVYDFGGYVGDWTEKISKKYNPFIRIYEPVKTFYEFYYDKFIGNDKIEFVNKAIWSSFTEIYLGVNKSDSGIYCNGDIEKVETVDVVTEIERFKKIDLIKINIEGSEYEVLNKMLYAGCHKKVFNLLIQFHDYIDNCEDMIKDIHYKFEKTHELIFSFPYIWEHWRIKK